MWSLVSSYLYAYKPTFHAQEINLDKQENNKQKLSSDVVSKTTKAVVVESGVQRVDRKRAVPVRVEVPPDMPR
jgi:hypothetical protein